MQPQTVSPVQHKKYNVEYQMSKIRCGYDDMDTFFVQENGDFSRCSIIDSQNENLYLYERPDLKQHLRDKVAHGVPAWLGKSMLEESRNMFEDDEVGAEVETALKGATYVSLEDSIKLDKSMRTSGLNTCIAPPNRGVTDPRHFENVQYTPPWPRHLINVHTLDKHGAAVPYLGEFVVRGNRTFDARIVWCMASFADKCSVALGKD